MKLFLSLILYAVKGNVWYALVNQAVPMMFEGTWGIKNQINFCFTNWNQTLKAKNIKNNAPLIFQDDDDEAPSQTASQGGFL